MLRPRRQSNKILRRAAAWLLLLVCAWMGSGGALHHTDTEFAARTVPNTASRLHRQTAAAPVDSCAACQWTQGLQGRTVTAFPAQFPLAALRPRLCPFVTVTLARIPRVRSSRAPPVFSSAC